MRPLAPVIRSCADRWLSGAILAAAVGCSSGSELVCGAGTVARDGVCVPVTVTTCGVGTVLREGTCVPEGITCGPGTTAVDGVCVAPTGPGCGQGLEPVDNVCVPYDVSRHTDVREAAEPNGLGETPTGWTLPAVGETLVLGGTMDSKGFGIADADAFVFEARGGERLALQALPGGVPVTGAMFQRVDVRPDEHPDVCLRLMIGFSTRTPARAVTVPGPGRWALVLGHQGNLLGSETMSGPGLTYGVSVERKPDVVPQTVNGAGTISGRVENGPLFVATPGEGVVWSVALGADQYPGLRSIWAYSADGRLIFSNTETEVGTPPPAQLIAGAAPVTVGVEDMLRVADGAPFSLTFAPVEVPRLPPARFAALTWNLQPGTDGTVSGLAGVELQAGRAVRFHVDRASMGEWPENTFELLDPSMTPIAVTPGGSILARIRTTGLHFLRFRELSPTRRPLNLPLTWSAFDTTDWDPVSPGDVRDTTVTITPNESRWIHLPFSAAARWSVSATGPAGALVRLRTWSFDAREASAWVESASAPVTIDGPSLGTRAMWLEVQSATTTPVDVLLQAQASAPDVTSEREPNDTRPTAETLSPFDAAGLTERVGALDTVFDDDFYAFEVPGAASAPPVAVQLDAVAGPSRTPSDLRFMLYDAAGSILSLNNDWNGSVWPHLEQPLAPGRYTVRVSVGNDFASAVRDYKLQVRIAAP